MSEYMRQLAEQIAPSGAYAWVIDRDHLDDGDDGDEKGTMGPRDASDELLAALKAGKGASFRMFDDDDELYYSGRIVFAEEYEGDELPEEAFRPLEDFGTPNAGAVYIKYRMGNPKKWRVL